MIGPGKYDDVATEAREETEAQGVVLIILDGKHGNGFSVQASPEFTLVLPELLRRVAKSIEEDMKGS